MKYYKMTSRWWYQTEWTEYVCLFIHCCLKTVSCENISFTVKIIRQNLFFFLPVPLIILLFLQYIEGYLWMTTVGGAVNRRFHLSSNDQTDNQQNLPR